MRLALPNTQPPILKLGIPVRLQSQPSHCKCLWNSIVVWN